MHYPILTKNHIKGYTYKRKLYLNDLHSLCIICLEGRHSNQGYNKHHLSYDPQVIAWVHDDCHLAVHTDEIEEFIYYTSHEAKTFRNIKI